MSERSPTSSLRVRATAILKLLIAAGLLALLFINVPWGDRVSLRWEEREITLPVQVIEEPPGSGDLLARGTGSGAGWSLSIDSDGRSVTVLDHPLHEIGADGASGVLEVGLRDRLRRLSIGAFSLAFLLAFAGTLTATLRWKLLLGSLDIRVTFARALQLNLAGMASSQVLLGSVGGDLVKGALVARDEAVPTTLTARTHAIFAILMDRIVGLTALLTIGTLAAFGHTGTGGELFRWFGLALGLLLVGVVAVLLVAKRMQALDSTSLVVRVLSSVRSALALYASRGTTLLTAFCMALIGHSFLIVAIALLGRSLGIDLGWAHFFTIIPVVETIQAIPISPAGLGVAETMYVTLLREAGTGAALALTLAISVRALTWGQALLGVPGLLHLLRSRRTSEREVGTVPSATEGPTA